MEQRVPFQWNTANFAWSSNPYTWDDCALITGIITQMGGSFSTPPKLNKEKKKQFIKLLCKVEGVEYKENKEIIKRQIRITDIVLVAKEVLGIDVKIER